MKKILLTVVLLSLNLAFAEKSVENVQHEAHHPKIELKKEEMKTGADNGMMNGKMDSSHMEMMMKNCMDKMKDGKKCEHKMMNMCQEKMSKDECHQMIKNK
jgi:hypothetical protein